jgi:hypothetical protein
VQLQEGSHTSTSRALAQSGAERRRMHREAQDEERNCCPREGVESQSNLLHSQNHSQNVSTEADLRAVFRWTPPGRVSS